MGGQATRRIALVAVRAPSGTWGWQGPSDDDRTHGSAVLLLRKRAGPVWWLGRLPAPPGSQHRVVAARGRSRAGQGVRGYLLGGASAQPWLASITGLLLLEARFLAFGWGCWPLAQRALSSRLVQVIVECPVSSETRSAPIPRLAPARARAAPILPPPGVWTVGRRARGPRLRPCLPGCSFGSNRAQHWRRPRPRCCRRALWQAFFGRPAEHRGGRPGRHFRMLPPVPANLPRKARWASRRFGRRSSQATSDFLGKRRRSKGAWRKCCNSGYVSLLLRLVRPTSFDPGPASAGPAGLCSTAGQRPGRSSPFPRRGRTAIPGRRPGHPSW